MEEVDILVKDAMILTLDSHNTILEKGYVGIKGDLIVALGSGAPGFINARKELADPNTILMPGLVNAHTHVAMSLFRGLADDLPLMEWLNAYIFPVEKRMDADFVYVGALLGCAEMILSGTTTFCDMYLFEDAVAKAAKQAGMRCLVGEVLYDFPSPNYGNIDKGFEYTEFLIKKWADDPLISVAVEPHSLFTCSPELLKTASKIADKYSTKFIIHVAETKAEVEQVMEKYGNRPIRHMAELGLLNDRLIIDHCVHVTDSELDMLSDSGANVVHNPESNMKLASGVAPVPSMLHRGITVALGTDGCASNNNLDLFTEMDTAAKLHKVHTVDPTVMDSMTVLRMATIEGAKALGMDHIIGSIEVGKKADLILINTDKPHLTPMYNPYSHIVYSATGSDVTHVVINGELVMENRRPVKINMQELNARLMEKAELVRNWIKQS